MRQKSIGEVLSAARESSGWTFLELQRALNIRAKFLQALEYNDFEAIPDPTYARSYLKSYAEFLELDADVLLDAYDRKSLVIYYDAGEERDVEVDLRRHHKTKPSKVSYLPLIYLILAALSILLFVGYIVYSRIQNLPPQTQPSSSYRVVSPSSTTSSETTTSTQASTTTTTPSHQAMVKITPSTDGAFLQVTVTQAQKPVEVEVSVTQATSWISMTGTEFAGGVTLSPQNKTVTAKLPENLQTTTVTLGVVEGVAIKVAGQTVDLSGLTSQTGTVQITIE